MEVSDLEKQASVGFDVGVDIKGSSILTQTNTVSWAGPWRLRGGIRRYGWLLALICLGGVILHLRNDHRSWRGADFLSTFDPKTSLEPKIPRPISWGQNLSSSSFISNLTPIQFGGIVTDLPEEDKVHRLGPTTYDAYSAFIDDFVSIVLPPRLQLQYRAQRQMEGFVGLGSGWDTAGERKFIWQTDVNEDWVHSGEVMSWSDGSARGEGWDWRLMTDELATTWVKENFGGTRLELLWDNLPSGILKADLIRYLLLTVHGGVYTDTDTQLLKAPSRWGRGADLWKGGKGWMSESNMARLETFSGAPDEERDREVERLIGRAKVIVGIEADVGGREDWAQWWPRPLQIVQWTMAAGPYHPIMISTLHRILYNTATAVEFAHEHYGNYTNALLELSSTDADTTENQKDRREQDLARMSHLNVLSEPREGGPLGVINWTGPSVFTDSVLSYLLARYGLTWRDLRDLRRPLRIGDVLVLPVTGFSPGVGNFGAGDIGDEQAMVEHRFRGSWKHAET